jgi:hypothetical protein
MEETETNQENVESQTEVYTKRMAANQEKRLSLLASQLWLLADMPQYISSDFS